MNLERRARAALKRRRLLAAAALLGFFAALVFPALLLLDRGFPPPLGAVETSRAVTDRDGALLRPFAIADGRWRLRTQASEVDPRFLAMLIAYEDRRFLSHHGVDVLALLRAIGQFIGHGRVVSGASTITMQLARLLEPGHGRGLSAKLRQMARALQIERRLSKDEILSLYLTLAPYGGNLEGVRAASLAYFGREPRRLEPSQAALLVSLPQAPEARRPDRAPQAARAARDQVLARMARAGVLSWREAKSAAAQPLSARRREFPAHAAHAALAARLAPADARGEVRLTISLRIQRALEQLAKDHAGASRSGLSVAILAADHRSGEILAHVGSTGFFDGGPGGQIDMANAARSPGSTLKPLIYGLAFETGLVRPATMIDDRPADFSGYRPHNFDQAYQGSVTVAEALQLSLNVPAVRLLDAVGPVRLISRLRRAGIAPRLPGADAPGLAIALGGLGLSLKDLVQLYGAFAGGGEMVPLHAIGASPDGAAPVRLLEPAASWYVASILAGVAPPRGARGAGIAYKTGTSYGYRDAWAIGFDGAYTIGVWVGRPDGTAVPGLTGISHAAPVLFEAFTRIALRRMPLAPAPAGAALRSTGELPPPLRYFASPSALSANGGAGGPKISFPPDGAHVDLGLERGAALALKVQGGALPFRWLANGHPLDLPAHRRQLFWPGAERGFSTLTVIDAEGRSSAVRVFLD